MKIMKWLVPTIVFASLPVTSTAQELADTIWSGGPILTIVDNIPRAEAVAVKDGLIIAVGTLSDVSRHKGDTTDMIDLSGRSLLPGFVDGHGHVFLQGMQAGSANMLPAPDGPVNDIPTLQSELSAWADANSEIVDNIGMILGFGYDDAQLSEVRHPTRDELDVVSTELPVAIIHQSSHLAVFNSKALEMAGYTADTPDPAGGVIRRRDGSTEPNGVLEETAFFASFPSLVQGADPAIALDMVRAGVNQMARFGFTTAQEGRAAAEVAEAMKAVGAAGDLSIDVVLYTDITLGQDYALTNTSNDYVNGFRVGGYKLTIDGSPQGFTALRDRPYYNPPENFREDYSGYAAVATDDIFAAFDFAFANDIQIMTHANGEGASDLLIAAIDAATQKYGDADRRPVLIHGQFLREDQIDAFKELGVFPSLFPMHTFYWGDWHRERTVGPVNAENISPTGWLMERDMIFSTHHDAPVAFPDSMRVLDATVTRRTRSGDILGPHHRVDVMTALKAMTIWPAYQHFEEDRKGTLEVGKLADFVVLSNDPTSVDPESLEQIQVLQTIKEGEVVFERE